MKKLILIFTLLIISFNVSANLLNDRDFLEIMRSESREQLAQESFDTYETFLEFNKQQDRDNPTGSRVSEDLMSDARIIAMIDLVQYAIIESFEAAIARDETITTLDDIQEQDRVNGINAAREIIGPLFNNPVFSVAEQALMSTAVNNYLNEYQDDRSKLNGPSYSTSILLSLGENRYLYQIVHDGATPRGNMEAANRFGRNFLSTFFTNQNAIQSTCPGGGSCASPVGGM